jgi:hypothetical protein
MRGLNYSNFHDYCYGKVSTSGYEAFDSGHLRKNIIVVNKDRQIAEAKSSTLFLRAEYMIHRTDVKCTWKK